MKPSNTLFLSGCLAAFTAAVHAFVGTPEIQGPLLQSSMPKATSLLLLACWHLVTVTLALSAATLIWCSRSSRGQLVSVLPQFLSLLWLLFGLVFIAVALLYSGPSALWALPQWALLLPVGVLGLLGARSSNSHLNAK